MMLFCFGLGYVAKHLIKSLNVKSIGTHREGTENIVFNEGSNFNLNDFKDITHLLISIPPINNTDLVYQKLHHQINKLSNLEWVGYLSATSVYEDANGAWVDEDYQLNQIDQRALDRQKAEDLWLNSGLPIHIFRLAAIYGKGRSVVEQILSGTARRIYKENHVFSRIHIDDIVATLIASMNHHQPLSIYNLADDCPSSHMEVVEFACELLGMLPPKIENFDEAELSEMLRKYYLFSRRISNKKIKEELGVRLKYPSYREGIAEIVQNLQKYL